MNYNHEKCIVMVKEGSIPKIYDFLRENETEEEAENRGFWASMENMNTYLHHHEQYPNVLEDGTEYWQNLYEAENKTEYKVMNYEEFKTLERSGILAIPLEKVSEECYQEMRDVLPPLCFSEHGGFEMFCMVEFYTGSYTMQYAKDKKTGTCYKKLVDFTDRSTWICELLNHEKQSA